MNPMIRKELRQRMRERRAWLVPSIYLAVLGGVVALAYYSEIKPQDLWGFAAEKQGAEIGITVFMTVVFCQMGLLLLLAPVYSAGTLTIEKEQRTLAGLMTSLLEPFDIWWGKFAVGMLFLTLLLASALPALSLAFALGGIGPLDVARATGVTLFILLSMVAIGLYCSSFFRRSVHATAACYAVVIALTVLTAVAYALLDANWGSSAAAMRGRSGRPSYIEAPLYLNPFYTLVAVFMPENKAEFPDWLISLQLFGALGLVSTALALRNLARSGEQT